MNLKPKQFLLAIVTTALISCIITASLVLSTTTTSTFYISGGIYPGAPAYTDWSETDGNYYAKDANGLIAFYGTNGTTVIQSALDGLTVGRTWKEKVVLKGLFTLTNPILISSDTILDIQGEIIIPASMVDYLYLISNKDHVLGNVNIEILNGRIDGNLSSDHATPTTMPTDGLRPIRMYAVQNLTIDNVEVYCSPTYGIELARIGNVGCERAIITRCRIYNAWYDGIICDDAGQVQISNNIVEYTAFRSGLGDSISAYNGSSSVIITNNWVRWGNGSGIGVVSSVKGITAFVTVSGNLVYDCDGAGVLVSPESASEDNRTIDVSITGNTLYYNAWGIMLQFVSGVTVSGNVIAGSTYSGIWANTSDCLSIVGNSIYNNAESGGDYQGITILDSDSIGVLISSCNVIDDRVAPTQIGIKIAPSVVNCTIIGCSVLKAKTYGIWDGGTGTKIGHCWNGSTYIAAYP